VDSRGSIAIASSSCRRPSVWLAKVPTAQWAAASAMNNGADRTGHSRFEASAAGSALYTQKLDSLIDVRIWNAEHSNLSRVRPIMILMYVTDTADSQLVRDLKAAAL